jgi:hypothetical protein
MAGDLFVVPYDSSDHGAQLLKPEKRAFTQYVSAKFEYLHYDLGTLNYGASQTASISCPGSNPANSPFAFVNFAPPAQIKGDIVRVGLNIRLGEP